MARFKNKDLRLDTNEEVLLGDSQEASLSYDGADLISSLPIYASTAPTKDQHLTNKTFVDGEISDTRDYIDDVVKGLEWQNSVLSLTTAIPTSGGEGDRYISPSGGGVAWDSDNTHAFITLSNENLTTHMTNTGSWVSAIANTFKISGKWYWEITVDVWPVTSFMIGIARTDMSTLHFPGQIATGVGYYDNNGVAYYNGVPTAYGDTYGVNDVIGVALDLDNGKVFFSKNDVWQNSGDPVAGTNPAESITPALGWGPAIGYTTDLAESTANFGGSAFVGTVPTGFTGIGSTGDAWFVDDILEWETSTWTVTAPSAGFATWVIDEGAYYIYTGSLWDRMGSVVDHSLLDNLDVDDHTQYVLADGTRGMTSLMVYGTMQSDTVSAGTFEGSGYTHAGLIDVHNLTTDINHDNITNTHNLTTDVDHDLITNTHNLSADIDHGLVTGLADDDHTQYLLVDGTRGMSGTLTVSGDILPGGGTLSIGDGSSPFDHIYCNTLHTSGGTVYIGDARLYEIGGTLYSETTIVAPSGSDPGSLVTNERLEDFSIQYGLAHDHDSDYYTQTLLDGGQLDGLYYTQTAADLAFAPLSHNNTNHSDTYITTTGVTYGALDGNSDIGTGSDQVSQGDHLHAGLDPITSDILPASSDTYDLGHSDAVWDNIWCNTLHTSAGSVEIGTTTLSEIGGILVSDTEIQSPSGSGDSSFATVGYVDQQVVSPSVRFPRGHLWGLECASDTDSLHDILISVGECRDANDSENMALLTVITKRIDDDWSAGDDNGGFPSGISITANTTYHFFLIGKTDGTVDAGWDSSLTATNLLDDATGYTLYRRIGSFLLNSSSDLRKFWQNGDRFRYDITIRHYIGASGTTRLTQTATVPIGIQIEADVSAFAAYNGTWYGLWSSIGQTNDVPDSTHYHKYGTAGANSETMLFRVPTSNGQYYVRFSTNMTSYEAMTFGWFDTRGRIG